MLRTPTSVFQAQLEAWDVLTNKLSGEDPFFKKVVDSQKAWAKDVVYYWAANDAPFPMGYEHVFKTKLPGSGQACK